MNDNSYLKKIIVIIWGGLIVFSVFAQEKQRSNTENTNINKSGIKKNILPILENISTNIEGASELRDPFKKPDPKTGGMGARVQNRPYWVEDGVITNVGGAMDPSTIKIDKIQINGILLGPERRVMVSVGKNSMVLKEGMKFGPKKELELKAILPAGVVFVEKIKNVYNQDEYIETIIPVQVKSK